VTVHEEIPQHFVVDDQLWTTLQSAECETICRNCGVTYEESTSCYRIPALDEIYGVFPHERIIVELNKGIPPNEKYSVEVTLFLLHYLLGTKDIPLREARVSEKDLSGGEMFFRGPHTLPTQGIVQKFGNNAQGLLETGKKLNGKQAGLGDAAIELFPAPKIPVTYILWVADEEFPASVSILFDPTVEEFLPLDIVYGACIYTAHRLVE
jgi:hypothetical protein